MKSRALSLLVLSLLLCLSSFAYSAENQQKILIGLIPEMNVFKQKERFRQLGVYLSQKTGVEVAFTILPRYGNIIERFEAEKMDGAFFGSFTGALAIEKLGVVPLARPVNPDSTSSYRGYLFVRKDSGIQDVSGMKDKRMVYVDKATTAGYIFPLAYLGEHGIVDIEHFFNSSYFAGSHDAAIHAVLIGEADVGAAKHSVYDREVSANPRIDQELRIIAESPWVPSNGLCVRKDLDEALKKKLQTVLLNLHAEPAGEEVLKKFGALKFIETTAGDYAPVFDLARQAGIDITRYDYLNK